MVPHFAQVVEQSVTTLAKDPHGEVDEAQFIDASKLVIKKAFFLFFSFLSDFAPFKEGILYESCASSQPRVIRSSILMTVTTELLVALN